MNLRLIATGQLTLAIGLAALVSVLAKLALREVPAFTFVWLQIAIGIVVLTAYTFAWRGERLPRGLGRKTWLLIAIIGICNFGVGRVMFMLSLERLPATTHAYLIQFTAIVTMIVSSIVLRESPSLLQILGMLLSIAGLRVFFRELPPPDQLTGVIYVGFVVVALATYNNVARKLAHLHTTGLSNNVVSTVALWIGGIPVVLAGLTTDLPLQVHGATNFGIIALNGIVSVAIVMTVFNFVLRTLRSYEASILASTGVIFTAVFAIPILDESLLAHQIVGIGMMLVGIAAAQMRRSLFRGRGSSGDSRDS